MSVAGPVIRWARVSVAIACAVAVAACGDSDQPAAGVPVTTAPITTPPPSSMTTEPPTIPPITQAMTPAGIHDGALVASGQTGEPPPMLWLAVDLANEGTINGSGRVRVEVPPTEFGCGDELRMFDPFRVQPGANVTFEVVDGTPGAGPSYWYPGDEQAFPSVPAVRGRQARVECPAGTDATASELAANRALWDQEGPDSYEFTLEIQVFGPWNGKYDITVVDGEPVSIVGLDEYATPTMPDLPATIDAIFDVLERLVPSDSFVAVYHHGLGYPMSVEIDSIANAVDDEFALDISSFTSSEA